MPFFTRALLLFTAFFSIAWSFEYEGMIVEKIQIQSNVNVQPVRIKGALSLREGEPLSEQKLRADFRALYQLGLFQDLRFEMLPLGTDRVILTVVVNERYRIKKIRFVGNVKFAEDTLADEVPMKPDEYYSPSAVNRAINAIKEKYRTAGYLMTRVKPDVVNVESKKETIVTFEITEGSEMLVGQINFSGNSNLASKDIKKELQLHEDRWYREGKFDDLLLDEDKQKILYYYRKNGYINAKLLDTKLSYRWRDPNKKEVREVYIDFKVSEGEKFYFGDLAIRGMKLFSEEEIRKRLRRKAGEIFNQEIHDSDLQALNVMYQERGYIFARVTPIETVDEKTNRLSYLFDIYEGDKAHLERIFITGNDKTKDFVILRELDIKEGEIFNALKIRRSAEKVMNLQYFKNVIPDYKPGSVEGLMNLVFNVEEQRTGIISAGAGFGTSSGISFNAEIRENNFLGLGQSIGVKAEFGEIRKVLSFNFTEPWIFKLPISLGASITLSSEIFRLQNPFTFPKDGNNQPQFDKDVITNTTGDFYFYGNDGQIKTNIANTVQSGGGIPYTKSGIGFSVFTSYRFANWFAIGFTPLSIDLSKTYFDTGKPLAIDSTIPSQDLIRQQPIVIKQFKDNLGLLVDSREAFTYTTSLSFSRDTRDNNLNPSRGSLLKLSTDFSFFRNELSRWNFSYSKYQKLIWKFVLAYSFDVYTLGNSPRGVFKRDDGGIPDLNQFYYFNREEIRGWEQSDINTFRANLAETMNTLKGSSYNPYTFVGLYTYGQAKVRHGLEIRFPIAEQVLWGTLFIDAGNLSADMIGTQYGSLNFLNPFHWSYGPKGIVFDTLAEYMFDTGFGFRLQIPAFPIRLYFSWKFAYSASTGKFYNLQPIQPIFGIATFTAPIPSVVLNVFGFF
ncbi:MAG: outer membrane protein assembly factor BamA [Spirochaetia bacterium]|nr:outer membrane protein assembly factor BamA [Spirochaetia bacterium]